MCRKYSDSTRLYGSARESRKHSENLRGLQRKEAEHERDDNPESGEGCKSASVEPADGGVRWKQDASQPVGSGEWYQRQDVL